jgi:RiboL-PSP-HEPN
MSSLSVGQLGVRLNEVKRLKRVNPLRHDQSTDVATGNALNRASIVLLCAHLEGFLEDLVTEAIDVLVDHGARIENLPLVFRALHAEQYLREIELIKDRNARAPKIEVMFKSESPLWSNGQVLLRPMVRSNAVCAELGNPGSREVRQFLELVGVNIEQFLRDAGQSDLLGKINGLVTRRNQIAHGEVSASATTGDVDQYLQAVEDLGRLVDDAVGAAIMEICALTSVPW